MDGESIIYYKLSYETYTNTQIQTWDSSIHRFSIYLYPIFDRPRPEPTSTMFASRQLRVISRSSSSIRSALPSSSSSSSSSTLLARRWNSTSSGEKKTEEDKVDKAADKVDSAAEEVGKKVTELEAQVKELKVCIARPLLDTSDLRLTPSQRFALVRPVGTDLR